MGKQAYPPARQARNQNGKARKADFSPSAIRQAVIQQTLQKPYVLYPAAIGALGIFAALLIAPLSLFVVPAVVGSILGAGAWLFNSTIRREHHARAYLQQMRDLLAGQLDATTANLRADFAAQHYDRGIDQLERLGQKFSTFREMLARKLAPEELTHARYLGMTEQVFLAGLDNLDQAANLLKSTSAIDRDNLSARITALQSAQTLNEFQQRELSALESRLSLFDSQQTKVEHLLTQNEEALTQIDMAMVAIAAMNTEAGHATVDMETAMQELRSLAERAGRYSRLE